MLRSLVGSEMCIRDRKYVIKNYNGQIDKTDLGKGLSEILGNKNKNLKKSLFKDRIFKDHFFQNPQINDLLKPSIEIKSLDISILTKLLSNIVSKSKLKCCNECSHEKCSCGLDIKECPNKTNCKLNNCPFCKSSLCEIMIILQFCGVVRSLRNCFAHASKDLYDQLEKGQGGLEDFPVTKTWEDLWTLINDETTSCMGVVKNDNQLLPTDMYEDYKMEIRIPLKKEIPFLIQAVKKDLDHYYNTILGEENAQKKISELRASIIRFDKGKIF